MATTTKAKTTSVDTSAVVAGKVKIDTEKLNATLQKAQSLRGRLLAKHGSDYGDARREGVEISPEIVKLCTADEKKLLRALSAHNTLAKLVNG